MEIAFGTQTSKLLYLGMGGQPTLLINQRYLIPVQTKRKFMEGLPMLGDTVGHPQNFLMRISG